MFGFCDSVGESEETYVTERDVCLSPVSQDGKLEGLIYKLTSCSNCCIARKWDRENSEISWLTSSSWVSSDLFLLGLQIQLDSLPNVLEQCLSEPVVSCQSLPGCKWSISREGFCHSNTEGIYFLFTKTIWDLKSPILSSPSTNGCHL